MKVIVTSQDGLRRVAFHLHPWWHIVVPALFVTLLLTAFSMNQVLGLPKLVDAPPANTLSVKKATKIVQMLVKQLDIVNDIKQNYTSYHASTETLSKRIGTLEAEVTRLNAIAKRVVIKAKLDPNEFALEQSPARGGVNMRDRSPEKPAPVSQELLGALDDVAMQMERQYNAFLGLEAVLASFAVDEQLQPSAYPTLSGYISSRYGLRRDPFTGLGRNHLGVDFAGPLGTSIYAVASGVVSFSSRKGGYGNAVEIDHGDGLISRYAHLEQSLVEMGTVVKKGDKIALMGSTGRSTGSHLHLEILKEGKRLDPSVYLAIGD